jgi:hypothetical protein
MKEKEIFNKKEKEIIDKVLKISSFEKICKLLKLVLKIGAKRQNQMSENNKIK